MWLTTGRLQIHQLAQQVIRKGLDYDRFTQQLRYPGAKTGKPLQENKEYPARVAFHAKCPLGIICTQNRSPSKLHIYTHAPNTLSCGAVIQQCFYVKRWSLDVLCYSAGREAKTWYRAVLWPNAIPNRSFFLGKKHCGVPLSALNVCIWCSLTGACCSKLGSDKLHWETWAMPGNAHTYNKPAVLSIRVVGGGEVQPCRISWRSALQDMSPPLFLPPPAD